MGELAVARRGIGRVAAVIGVVGLGAACSYVPPAPAPVELRAADAGILGRAAYSPPPARIEPRRMAATPAPVPAQSIQGRPPPEIIPLDGPARGKSPAAAQRQQNVIPLGPPPSAAAASPPPGAEPSAAEEARSEGAASLPHGGHFPWPVKGRVLAGYGVGTSGNHNDGINIAAPRGAPISAVDGGIVAYAGNELRGYGNLVLIKHPSGWITAYAHCDELLVKRGDKVGRGQVIAKVGQTGGVSEPQLHFELRRGKQAVDPKGFLTPAPSADNGTHRAPSG